MKLKYVGTRTKKGCEIIVREEDSGHEWPLPPRLDLYNHSPTGFEWGYHGSGPAQTALAILASHLKKEEHRPAVMSALGMLSPPDAETMGMDTHEYLAVCYHQPFKALAIAGLDEDQWELTEDEIARLIKR